MKKIFLFLFYLFIIGIYQTNAQIQAGVVLGPQFPVGGFNDGFNAGMGFGLTGKYLVNENMAVGANLHYNSFSGNRYIDYYNNGYRNRAGITAFTGLFEYYFSTDKLKPYAGADLGLYFWNWRTYYNYYWNNSGKGEYRSYRGTALGFAPTAGATYDVTDKFVVCANLKFNIMITDNNLNYVGLNIAAFYKIDK